MDIHFMRILIADDEETSVTLLKRILQRAGFSQFRAIRDPRQIIPLYESYCPDLLLLDLRMPYLDGFSIIANFKAHLPLEVYFPIIVLTSDTRDETKNQALRVGAKDFLQKPYSSTEVVLRIRNPLEARKMYLELTQARQLLAEQGVVQSEYKSD